jgi:HPt (histidine-containing phosphotransfer) domain-containing protein
MTAPGASFLDFFALEASEYVEQIDGLVLRATDAGPDAEGLQRIARALRGSATMAKLTSFAELASGIEGVGRSLRAGSVKWDAGLKGVLVAAVEDLKILTRAARSWTPSEDQRAMTRVNELSRYAQLPAGSATPIASSSSGYFASETSNVAAGLELLATRPDDRVGGANVLARIRALRGVAGVKDVPGLAEVSEAAESAVRPLEMGEPRLTPEHINLLRVAADLLRAIAAGLVAGTSVTTSTPQYKAFLTALDGIVAHSGADRVVPIADLFYNDAGPHIVMVAPNPPTTPAQRFRLEVVSLGEHLHRVIDEARRATEAIQQEHAKGELGRALRAIRATAASFSQMAVAQTVEAYLERTGDLNAAALDAISQFAATISPAPATPAPAPAASVPIRPTHIGQVAAALGSPGPLPRTSAVGVPVPVRISAPAPVHAAPPAPVSTGRGTPAHALDAHIAAFDALSGERLAQPANVEDDVVPVDALLYRGRAALDRAVELRDAIRRAGGTPAPEVLEELYDLVELARVE